jgi:hypothetical protein
MDRIDFTVYKDGQYKASIMGWGSFGFHSFREPQNTWLTRIHMLLHSILFRENVPVHGAHVGTATDGF